MIEKLLFKKIELWIVFLMLIMMLIGSVLFGAVVKYNTKGGKKYSLARETADTIASLPFILKHIITGKKSIFDLNNYADDYISDGIVSIFDLNLYKGFVGKESSGPKYYCRKGVSGLQPLTIQARINKDGDEVIAVFDDRRNLAKIFPIKVESMIKEIPARIGASPHHFFDDGSYLVWPYGGVGLFRLSPCGDIIWQQGGLYHHHFSIYNSKLYILGLPTNDLNKSDVKNSCCPHNVVSYTSWGRLKVLS